MHTMGRYSSYLLALVAVVTATAAAVEASALLREDADRASCAEAGLCCQGKNNTCRVRHRHRAADGGVDGGDEDADDDDNSVLVVARRSTCFCDSACLDLADCCHDYQQTCALVDCVLADHWDEWGECSARCGTGIKRRVRRVIQPALNGGRPCPGNTVEKAVCEGTSCKVARASNGFDELRETAKIIPATYGPWRHDKKYNPYEDIRKNLYDHYGNRSSYHGPSYCMQFELSEMRRSCSETTAVGNKGQAAAAAAAGWPARLTKGSEVCVECQSLAMRRRLGGRCRGHGVMHRQTRWVVVAAAGVTGCHGKWTLKSRQESCQCSPESPHSFILV